MGEISDDVIDGLRCQECADYMPDMEAPGYPRTCPGCKAESRQAPRKAKRKR